MEALFVATPLAVKSGVEDDLGIVSTVVGTLVSERCMLTGKVVLWCNARGEAKREKTMSVL